VCCATYWQRHSIDEAGVVGVQLQKLLFFLSAMTIISLFSMETATMLAGASALMLYAIGLVGAQKRDIRYLRAYGVVSILIIVLTCIAGLVLVGMMTVNPPPMNEEGFHPRNFMKQHGMGVELPRTFTTLPRGAIPASTLQHGVYDASLTRNTKIHPELAVLAPHNKRQDVQTADLQENCDFQVTPFGWAMLALGSLVALLMFVIKIKTIALAFRMRRMLVSLAAQRLPVTMSTMPTSAAAAAICNSSNVCTSKPMMASVPETRRECERCTFVNVAATARCAMCDSPLPLAAAPVHVNGAPKIYVAGSYVPMNQV